MTYVITEPCIDLKDKTCLDECQVDCIYEGELRMGHLVGISSLRAVGLWNVICSYSEKRPDLGDGGGQLGWWRSVRWATVEIGDPDAISIDQVDSR
jgi:hypothetical protein